MKPLHIGAKELRSFTSQYKYNIEGSYKLEKLSHKYNEYYKEEYDDSKNFKHQISIGRNRPEIFQKFSVGSFDIHFCVINIGIDPGEKEIIEIITGS